MYILMYWEEKQFNICMYMQYMDSWGGYGIQCYFRKHELRCSVRAKTVIGVGRALFDETMLRGCCSLSVLVCLVLIFTVVLR